jgi:hypothetical protein
MITEQGDDVALGRWAAAPWTQPDVPKQAIYLGSDGPREVLYDPKAHRTLRVPSGSVILLSANS